MLTHLLTTTISVSEKPSPSVLVVAGKRGAQEEKWKVEVVSELEKTILQRERWGRVQNNIYEEPVLLCRVPEFPNRSLSPVAVALWAVALWAEGRT